MITSFINLKFDLILKGQLTSNNDYFSPNIFIIPKDINRYLMVNLSIKLLTFIDKNLYMYDKKPLVDYNILTFLKKGNEFKIISHNNGKLFFSYFSKKVIQ